MKRFRFPLRPVAILRAHLESRAREAFAVAVQRYVGTQETLDTARRRATQLEAALHHGRSGSFNAADEAWNLQAYRREADVEIEAERAVFAAAELVRQRRNEYLEAHRQAEVVRRLELRARVAHRLAAAREEQAEFDDFAGRRAARQKPFFAR